MKDQEFHHIDNSSKKLKDSFLDLSKDFLTQADIDRMAENFASEIKEKLESIDSKDKQAFIIHALDEKRISKLVSEIDHKITAKDLEPHLTRIRKAVLDKIKSKMDIDVDIHMISKTIAAWSAIVSETYGGKIVKQDVNAVESVQEDHKSAMERLFKLKDNGISSPHVAYTLIARGKQHGDPRRIDEIHSRLNVTALDELIKNDDRPPLKKVLEYYLNAIEGLKFLTEQGFVLTDNALDNIAVDKDRDVGMLFDLDALLPNTTEVENGVFRKLSRLHFIPPERQLGESSEPKTIKEAEMIYECGVTLNMILRVYGDNGDRKLGKLLREMKFADPKKRPTFEEVINVLKNCTI